MTARNGSWMQTVSGRAFWPLDPRPEEIEIEDIAHALSMLCRYGGHCTKFYSVAEHSVLVSRMVPPEHALCGLMHDATEAYLVDLPRPIKRHMPEYKLAENRLWLAIAERFDLPIEIPACVHDADNRILLAEKAQVMRPSPEGLRWAPECEGMTAPAVSIVGWPHFTARPMFLARFSELTEEKMV